MDEHTEHATAKQNQEWWASWHKQGHHVLLRWVLGIIILLAVFSVGFKLGEFKSDMQNGYGFFGSHMRSYGGGMMYRGGYDGYGPGMMRGGYYGYPEGSTTLQ
jgi:hypothetical protein